MEHQSLRFQHLSISCLGHCYGLHCIPPPQDMLVSINVTLFGNKVMTDVISKGEAILE